MDSPTQLPSRLTSSLAALFLVCGCESTPPEARVVPRFDPTLAATTNDADTWLAFPFPSDHRRTADGHIRVDDFPNPRQVGLLDEFLDEAQSTLDGFSVAGLAYFAFDGGGIDPQSLPATAAASLEDSSAILLVDVTEGDPAFGSRHPIRTHVYQLDEGIPGVYLAEHTLGVGPAWGFPLEERHTYALVLRDTLRAADGSDLGRPALVEALLADRSKPPRVSPAIPGELYDELRTSWSGLRAYLADEAIDPDSVVVVTVFTTQTITADLEAIAAQIAAAPAPTMLGGFDVQAGGFAYTTRSFAWSSTATVNYGVYRGSYLAPNYQEGTIPYASSGGALHVVSGVPAKVRDESLRFVLTVPSTPPDASRGCYPVVMYGHGTGGDRESFIDDGTAGRLAARGMAGLSIDMPLHGDRAEGMTFGVDLVTFNFTNPPAFRSNFRQGAIDLMTLTRLARESLAVSAGSSHTGSAIALCDDGVGYMGHSQGGLTGALAIPFLDDVGTFMISGAGGGIAITVMERKDIVDFEALFKVVFDVPAAEDWDEAHPLATLVQTLADVSDPASYARYWNHDRALRPAANVMLTNGLHDEATPYRSAIALALSARLRLTTPVALPIPEYALLGGPVAPPLLGDSNGRTAAFLQYGDDLAIADADTHFLVFSRPEAIDASMRFLQTGTGTTGIAELRRNPSADAR